MWTADSVADPPHNTDQQRDNDNLLHDDDDYDDGDDHDIDERVAGCCCCCAPPHSHAAKSSSHKNHRPSDRRKQCRCQVTSPQQQQVRLAFSRFTIIIIMIYSHQEMHIKSTNIPISSADNKGRPSLTHNN